MKQLFWMLLLLLVAGAGVYIFTGTKQSTTTHATSNVPTFQTSDKVTGPPSVSAAFIDRVLTAAGSPAKGIGATMYRLGVQYGIDPVFALAFFRHESSFGLRGMAITTMSIGNIRCTPGWRCDPSGGYRAYASWAAGVADWYTLIKEVYIADGRDQVSTIIPKYAPAGDNNDEQAYIASVMADVNRWRGGHML
jgi:hypothetical protein